MARVGDFAMRFSPNYSPVFGYFLPAHGIGRVDGDVLI
jgi:hypothetical protein